MKGNFHVQFGIGGGEGDFIADHTNVGKGISPKRVRGPRLVQDSGDI